MTSKRLNYIDIAKGIGILFVICSHSRCNELMWFAWAFFMPVFFIISGYTYQYKDIPLWQWIRKKAYRLLIPYFFTNFMFICILGILGKASLHNLFGIIYSRFYCFPEGPILLHWWCAPTWFLTALFTAYILVFLTKNNTVVQYICIPIFILISYGFNLLPILLPWSLDTAFIFASYIFIGILIRKYHIILTKWKNLLLIFILYFIIIYYNGDINYSIRILGNNLLLTFITGTLGSILVIRFSKLIELTRLNRPLIALGRNSLLIFCFHIPIISTFNIVFEQTLYNASKPVLYFGGFCSIISTAYLGYHLSLLLYKTFPFLK